MSLVTELGEHANKPMRPWWPAMKRGLRLRCPHCGEGQMFRAYLKVNDECPACGEELHHHRADDAPPYLTITIVGHIVIALLMVVDAKYPAMNMAIHMVVWSVLAIVLSVWMLPHIKGALIAYQWALKMHGFETALPPRVRKQ